MIGNATITVFDYEEGGRTVTVVRVSLSDTRAGESCHSWEYLGEMSLLELLSKASDAVVCWHKHGAMFSEPLGSGWRRGL